MGRNRSHSLTDELSHLSYFIADVWDELDAPLSRVTGADVPTPYAANLEALAFPDDKVIVKVARDILDKKY
jgi:pyruvate dehydrogenase E1 component beta subunit